MLKLKLASFQNSMMRVQYSSQIVDSQLLVLMIIHSPYPAVDETNNSLELMVTYTMCFVSTTKRKKQ